MTDLFGDTITALTIQTKALINLAWGFPEFWKAWPSGPRKVAKQQCLDKWAKYECCKSATLICQHVEWLKTQDDWQRGFVCAPLVYLNQQRWIDWEPPMAKPKAPTELEKMDAHAKLAVKPPESIRAKIKKMLGVKN